MMRCFFALELPPPVRAGLAATLEKLRRLDAPVRWVRPDNLHVTVKFLGDCTPGQVEELGAALGALRLPELRARIEGLGCFPPRGAPRVVWAGLAGGEEALAALAAEVDGLAAGAGFARERRPFQAHVTLGRVKSPRGARRLGEALVELSPSVRSEEFVFPHLVLFESERTPEGSRYRRLYEL